VKGPCRWFTKVSDSIVSVVWTLIVAGAVVVEVKTVDHWKVGLLSNFNVALLRGGIHRRVSGAGTVATLTGPPRTAVTPRRRDFPLGRDWANPNPLS